MNGIRIGLLTMHFNYSLGPDPQLAPNCHTRSGELAPFATLLHIAAFPSSNSALLHSSHLRRSCHCPIPAALPHRPCVHWFSPSSLCVSPQAPLAGAPVVLLASENSASDPQPSSKTNLNWPSPLLKTNILTEATTLLT